VRWLRTADTLQVADRLGDLQVPARVVWGAADPFQKLPYGERLAWDLHTELWPIEGGQHFTPRTTPSGWPPPSARSSAPSAPADPVKGSWRRTPPASPEPATAGRATRQAARATSKAPRRCEGHDQGRLERGRRAG
jgi:hypothetical protein